MKNNIKKPLFIIGENANNSLLNKISKLEFEILTLPADKRLPPPTMSHADMLLFLIDTTIFCNETYFKNNSCVFKKIKEYGYSIIPCDFEVGNSYPLDVSLNQALIGKYLIGNKKACATKILEYAALNKYSYISTKQGYAKCSTLILNENAIITADDSISNITKKLNIETLKINNGEKEISLLGYNYGFIGGASTVYNKTVFFFGNIALHSNEKEITDFCKKHGFSTISLTELQLEDVGGAFILPDIMS